MTEQTDFGTFGRYRETPVADMPADMKEAYLVTKGLRLFPGRIAFGLPIPCFRKRSFPPGRIISSTRR